jgi:alpha-glucosidase
LTVLNLSHRPAYFKPKDPLLKSVIALATSREREGNTVGETITLGGDEGMIIRLD